MEITERGWSKSHPRFVMNDVTDDSFQLQLDEDLLEVALHAYNLTSDNLGDIPIIVEEEADPVELKRVGGGALFGSFITYFSDQDTDITPDIKLYVNPHRGYSKLGLYVHIFDKGKGEPLDEMLSINLSTTLIHELGHLAAHCEAPITQLLPPRVRPGTAIFRDARRAEELSYRKKWEELWVKDRTESIARQHPELARLIVANNVETA